MTATMTGKDPIKALGGVASRDLKRVPITGIRIDGGAAVATNGCVLVRVPYTGDLAPGLYRGPVDKALAGQLLEDWEYPNYKAVIPDWKPEVRIPLTATVVSSLKEVAELNKRNGVKPWDRKRKLFAERAYAAQFTAARFEAGGVGYYFDPFQLLSVIQALRKSGYPATCLMLSGDPSLPARVETLEDGALGVIMPVRADARYITVRW